MMTRSRRNQPVHQSKDSRRVSRRLRQKARPDYHEYSDSSSPAQLTSAVTSQQSISEDTSEYAVRSILRKRRNTDDEVEYLIDWANHPTTGEQYSPTWEPRQNLNPSLEAAWLHQQHKRGLHHIEAPDSSSNRHIDEHKAVQSATKPKRDRRYHYHNRVRQRRITESSPSQSSPLPLFPSLSTRRQLQYRPNQTASVTRNQLGASDEAEVRALTNQASNLESQKNVSASSLFSPSIDYSGDYQPVISAETEDSSLTASASTQGLYLTTGETSSRLSTSDREYLLVPRSSVNPFRSFSYATRRFSRLAVIPDSQESRIDSATPQNNTFHSSGTSCLRQTNNHVFDDNISAADHLPLPFTPRLLENSGSVIPETQSHSISVFNPPTSLSSPSALAQSPLLEASLKQPNHSSISISQISEYLVSSRNEGFGGSKPDDSTIHNSVAESIPNAQRFAFSDTESHSIDSSQAFNFADQLRDIPQSTLPYALNPRLDIDNTVAGDSESFSVTNSRPHTTTELLISVQAIVESNMPTVRGGRASVPASQTDDGESAGPRKSLRGMRKEIETQRAQIKARTQKSTEQDDSQQRSPDSETQSSTGATKGRGRKKKDGEPSSLSAETNNKSNGTSSNGDVAAVPRPSLGPKLPSMQFIVPMPLVPQAGDQYRRTVVYNKVLIESFTATPTPSADLVQQATEFVQTMRNICLHLDLANEEESLSSVLASQQMTWDRSISSKFQLMGILLEQLQTQSLNVVIFAPHGKVIDMVEKFVLGYDLNLSRPDTALSVSSTQPDRQLTITLFPSRSFTIAQPNAPADLIIALDHGMDVHQPQVRAMRLNEARLAPVIFLVVLNSIDHVDKVMASTWKGTARLRTEIACLAKLRADAGRFNGEFQSVAEVGELIADFVVSSGTENDWPVVPIGPLADNESWDLATGQTILVNQEGESARKRSRDSSVDGEARNVKKVRTSSAPLEMDHGTPAATEISDSRVSESELLGQLSSQSSKYTKEKQALKAQLVELKAVLRKKDAHFRDLEKDFDKQMNRFEGQNRELEALKREVEEANKNTTNIRELKIRRDETIVTLKEENAALKIQLQEANRTLEKSEIPDIAELARLRREKAEAETAAESANKQAEISQNLTGYLQENYRTASDRAVEAVEQNEILEARVKELERKAEGEAVRLQQATSDNKNDMTTTELKRLRVELKNAKAVLAKKEEELKAKRGGIGTRAGSVPRSPRVGPSSRATSPIPDRRIETLRNNTFTGRGKAKNPRKVLDAEDASRAGSKRKEGPVTPKGAGRPEKNGGEQAKDVDQNQADVAMTDAEADSKLPDIQPAQPSQPPVAETKAGPPTSRPFPCCFAQYNCNASFTSKNEWKRHISTKHIQIGFWRCDMCNPSPGLDHPVYNDFNRKDLFTQHLRRMHAPTASSVPSTPNPQNPGTPVINVKEPTDGSSPSGSQPVLGTLTDGQIVEIQTRCFKTLRAPPHVSSCVFCSRVFNGIASWDERLEHVGGHMERDRKNGTNCLEIASWNEDPDLREYLVTEGIIEQDQRGNWRIGDGRPRRPLNLDMPSTPGTLPPGATLTFGSNTGDGSEEAMSKRRRGRPPKTVSETEDNRRFGPGTTSQISQAGPQDSRLRPEQSSSQLGTPQAPNHATGPSPHPTSEMRGPSMQVRNDSGPATPSGPNSQNLRLEPQSSQQFLTHHSHSLPHAGYARETSPTLPRSGGLPNIMPRTPQAGHNQNQQSLRPFAGTPAQQSSGSTPIAIAPAYHHQQQMHSLAPAPSRTPMVPDSNQHPVALNQLLAQQIAKAAMDTPSSGPQALAPAPPRPSHSPVTSGAPYYPSSAGPTGYTSHSQESSAFSSGTHHAQGQHNSAIEPLPTNSVAPSYNGQPASAMQSQIHPDFLDNGPDRPPSTGDNRAKSFREVMGIEKDAAA